MVDFPIKTSIYKGFSMAMLNNQMVSMLPFPMDPAVPSERKWDWDMVTRGLYKYLLRQWPWIHRDCCQLCKFSNPSMRRFCMCSSIYNHSHVLLGTKTPWCVFPKIYKDFPMNQGLQYVQNVKSPFWGYVFSSMFSVSPSPWSSIQFRYPKKLGLWISKNLINTLAKWSKLLDAKTMVKPWLNHQYYQLMSVKPCENPAFCTQGPRDHPRLRQGARRDLGAVSDPTMALLLIFHGFSQLNLHRINMHSNIYQHLPNICITQLCIGIPMVYQHHASQMGQLINLPILRI